MMLSVLLSFPFLVTCQAALAPINGQGVEKIIDGEYIVSLRPGMTWLTYYSLSSVTILKTYTINKWRGYHIFAEEPSLNILREDPAVDYVEVNAADVVHNQCQTQTAGSRIWGLTRISSRELPDYFSALYQYDSDGSGVDAYIVDTGIYIEHNDFGGRASHGFLGAALLDEGHDDLNSHGTHVAGTVGGEQFGVAKNVNLISVKVLNRNGSGYRSDIIAGVEYITQRHQKRLGKKSVANMSFSFSYPYDTFESAIRESVAAGVTYCVSAGHKDRDSCLDSPSRIPEVITVAASDINDNLARFTNYGTCVDIVAPGSSVLSASIEDPNAASTKGGTSMSAPHATGAAARYLSTFNEDNVPSPEEVKMYLKETSSKGKLTLESKALDTPNELLYVGCS